MGDILNAIQGLIEGLPSIVGAFNAPKQAAIAANASVALAGIQANITESTNLSLAEAMKNKTTMLMVVGVIAVALLFIFKKK